MKRRVANKIINRSGRKITLYTFMYGGRLKPSQTKACQIVMRDYDQLAYGRKSS